MNVQTRIRMIRLHENISCNKEYADRIGVDVVNVRNKNQNADTKTVYPAIISTSHMKNTGIANQNRRALQMTKIEIKEFIEQMESIGDEWTEEQVKDCYEDYNLEEALEMRKADLALLFNNISKLL